MSSDYAAIYDKVPDTILSHDDDSNSKKLWTIYAERMQAIQTIIDDLHYIRQIEEQSGTILDLIGEILHEERTGDDETYKTNLLISFVKLFCSGGIESLQKVLSYLLGDDLLGIYYASDISEATSLPLLLDGSWSLDGSFYLWGEYYEDTRNIENLPLLLDGSWSLDGSYYLSASYSRPAQYVLCIDRDSELIATVKKMIPSIKTAGIGFRIKEI